MSTRLFALCCVLAIPLAGAARPPLDDHGFPLPHGALARLGDLHFAQPGPITAMILSPDGKIIASAGGGIFLWDAETGLILRKLPVSGSIGALAFSGNG